jgi:anoctamin-10/anoctamin-7
MYGKYNGFVPEFPWRSNLYKVQGNPDDPRHKGSLFRSVDRIRLLYGVLQADPLLGGAGLKLFHMIRDPNHSLTATFPLHDPLKRKQLQKNWAHSWWPLFTQPLMEIRDYFGEKVAFYFAFLQFYCLWLIGPAILGALVYAWQLAENPHPRVDIEVLPFVGAVAAVWATLFLEFWKREEATLRSDWGMTNFVVKEQPRPEFDGERVRSPVDGTLIKHFPWYRRIVRFVFSQTVIWGFIAVVLAIVISIFFLRQALKRWNERAGLIITSLVNAVQIQILNVMYGVIADKLNEFENHRTRSEWENSLISKTFLFKFINSYNSLFYIAFFKRFDTGCRQPNDPNCLTELSIQLAIIFGSAIVVNNTIELLTPIILNSVRARQNAAVEEGQKLKEESRPELEFILQPYSTLPDFDELVVQFGYVSLFVVAFPLAPALALFNNYFEIRLDAKKITTLCQRPTPLGAATIGTFFDILTIVSFIAVLVNTLIVTFFTEIIDKWAKESFISKLAVFIVFERCVVLIKIMISYVVPDVPLPIQEHIQRETYIVDMLINGVEEETEEVRKRRNTLLPEYDGFSYDNIPEEFPTKHFASDVEFVGKSAHEEQQLIGDSKAARV